MSDKIVIDDISKVELDPNKQYIFRIGYEGMTPESFHRLNESLKEALYDCGVRNVVIVPNSIEMMIVEDSCKHVI